MGWYRLDRLIKIAGPKEKIQQFKIADVALQLFIMRYEGMIKWNGYSIENEETGEEVPKAIKSQDDINEFIRTQVLPKVYAKVDPENPANNYLKKFDVEKEYTYAKQNQIYNPELEHAYNLVQRGDPAGGEKFYLDVINRMKKQGFDGWINYIKDHPEYNQSPAFIYLLLNPIFDSSGPKTLKPPPAASPPVIAKMLQQVKNTKFKYDGPIKDEKTLKAVFALSKQNNPKLTIEQIAAQTQLDPQIVQDAINQNESRNIDIFKVYEKELADHCLEVSRQEFDGENKAGWLKLPKKANTKPRQNADGTITPAEKVFEENVEILHNFSVPNEWCTKKNSNGPLYLTAGDFWILVENGKANVGIRFGGEDILEIAGDQSYAGGVSRSCPTQYWREVTDLIFRENLQGRISGSSAKYHWERLLQERALNKSFFNEDGTPNQEEIEEFKKQLIADPLLFARVTDNEKFLQYPETIEQLKQACKQGWFKKIQALPARDAMQMAQNVAENAQNMPDFVLADPAFIENVHGRLTTLYQNNPERIKDVLEKVPNHWQMYPQGKEVFKQGVLQKYREGLYWRANAYGMSRKTKQQKDRITVAKISLQELQEAIGKYMPELNENREFEAAVNQIKEETAVEAIQEGNYSQELPKDAVNAFFQDPANIEKLATENAEKIANAHLAPHSRQTEDSVYLNNFMDKELKALAPIWIRRLPGYQQFVAATKQKVLRKHIAKFQKFEPEFKQDQALFSDYKKHMLGENRPLRFPPVPIDPMLEKDEEWLAAKNNFRGNIPYVIQMIKSRAEYFTKLPLDIQSIPEVYNAYIDVRTKSQFMPQKLQIILEYANLPPFLKDKDEVKKTYISMVKQMLFQGNQNNVWKVRCDTIDPVAFTDPEVEDYCERGIRPPPPIQPPRPPINPIGRPPAAPALPGANRPQASWYGKARLGVL